MPLDPEPMPRPTPSIALVELEAHLLEGWRLDRENTTRYAPDEHTYDASSGRLTLAREPTFGPIRSVLFVHTERGTELLVSERSGPRLLHEDGWVLADPFTDDLVLLTICPLGSGGTGAFDSLRVSVEPGERVRLTSGDPCPGLDVEIGSLGTLDRANVDWPST